ncbi:sigma factor-like helix-turn-helix DNA-binding protein [Patescibacteria group bacterium]
MNDQKKQNEKLYPAEVVSLLLRKLLKREQEVVRRRFALDGKPRETLESIGRKYGITRERIRQIELSGIKKIEAMAKESILGNLSETEVAITEMLQKYGGLMREDLLLESILNFFDYENSEVIFETKENCEVNKNNLLFIMIFLLKDKWHKLCNNGSFEPFWHLKEINSENIRLSIDHITNFLNNHGKPIQLDELSTQIEKIKVEEDKIFKDYILSAFYVPEDDNNKSDKIKKIIASHLNISKSTAENILSQWGLKEWVQIIPKRMNDKIYLVLEQHQKPLHFTEIAEKINEVSFDKKVAYPATIHNELILDNKYILVGRGVYALRNWGYNDGTVIQVIKEILKKENRPLSKNEIIDKVFSQRMVRKATILLSLTNRNIFSKDDKNKYSLV